jgi:hypothetical protein
MIQNLCSFMFFIILSPSPSLASSHHRFQGGRPSRFPHPRVPSPWLYSVCPTGSQSQIESFGLSRERIEVGLVYVTIDRGPGDAVAARQITHRDHPTFPPIDFQPATRKLLTRRNQGRQIAQLSSESRRKNRFK